MLHQKNPKFVCFILLLFTSLSACGTPENGLEGDKQNNQSSNFKKYAEIYCAKIETCAIDTYSSKEECIAERSQFYETFMKELSVSNKIVCGKKFATGYLACEKKAICEDLKCDRTKYICSKQGGLIMKGEVSECTGDNFQKVCHPTDVKEESDYSEFVAPLTRYCNVVKSECQGSPVIQACTDKLKQVFPFHAEWRRTYDNPEDLCNPTALDNLTRCIQENHCDTNKIRLNCHFQKQEPYDPDFSRERDCATSLMKQ